MTILPRSYALGLSIPSDMDGFSRHLFASDGNLKYLLKQQMGASGLNCASACASTSVPPGLPVPLYLFYSRIPTNDTRNDEDYFNQR